MTFNAGQPTNTTKLRNAPGVIRSNWEAIEEADSTFLPHAINYNNRSQLGGVPNNPAAIADAYILYCKEDPAGSPQLFGIDENSVISQFTSSVRDLDTAGYALLCPGILMQWGNDSFTDPNVTPSEVVTFTITYSAAVWNVIITPSTSTVTGTTPHPLYVDTLQDADFTVRIGNGTVATPISFNWIAIGPAPV